MKWNGYWLDWMRLLALWSYEWEVKGKGILYDMISKEFYILYILYILYKLYKL